MQPGLSTLICKLLLTPLVSLTLVTPSFPSDWIVSANDAKYQRVEGRDTYPENPPADTLVLLDASHFPPKVELQTEIENGVQGPPQAVAVTPNGQLALVAAPTRFNTVTKQLSFDTFLQVVDFSDRPESKLTHLELNCHPQGVAISPSGGLGIATCVDGSVTVLQINDKNVVSIKQKIQLGHKRLSGVSFTHDGKHILVAMREAQGIAVLNVNEENVVDSGLRLSSGVAPYTIDVSSDGHWAVVSNAGLAGLPDFTGKVAGDSDSVTLLDLSRTPYSAVQHITVPSLPEGVAISPNGRWIGVQAMNGSNLTPDNPNRHKLGKIVLLEIRNGMAVKVAEASGGEASQGIVFTADSRYLIVQFNVEKQLALFEVNNGRLKDTGQRVALTGGPSSLRTAPR